MLQVVLGVYAATLSALASLQGRADPGHLPAALIAIIALVVSRRQPCTAARLTTLSLLHLQATMIAAWPSVRPDGWGLGGAMTLVIYDAFRLLFFLNLGVLAVALRAMLRKQPEPWRPFIVTTALVCGLWAAALGWYRWPCWTGRGCARLITAELRRGNGFSAKWIAEHTCEGPCGAVLLVAKDLGDAEWAERVLGSRCSAGDRRLCRALGQLNADLGKLDRSVHWWDLACGDECRVDWDKLVQAHRWSDVERYLMNGCRHTRSSRCEDDVLPYLADLAQFDVDWGERTFAARCEGGQARACVARATLDWNTRRGDSAPWHERACRMGDPAGCKRWILRGPAHWREFRDPG